MANETDQPIPNEAAVKPAFQQPEPEQIAETDLQDIAGGATCHNYTVYCATTATCR